MVSVITINYNLASETIPCVRSILNSVYEDFIIFLVDNGSEQKDYQKLVVAFGENPRVKLLRIENNCGYVGGVNHGLKNAMKFNTEYYLVMNNDTILDKHAIDYLVVAAKRQHDKAIVTGIVYYFDQPDVIQHTGVIFKDQRYLRTIYPGKNEKDIGQFNEDLFRDSLDDVFWLLPSKVIIDIGLYSEYFFLYAEQGDFAQRARRKGYKLIFTPQAKIWHKVSMTIGGGDTRSMRICYWRGQGQFVFQYRNIKTKYFMVLLLKNISVLILKVILKKGNDSQCAIAMLRGYFWGIGWMLYKRPNKGYNPYP